MEQGFRVELEAVTLACWNGSVEVPRLGQVAHLSLFDKKTYQGPSGDFLIAAEDGERIRALLQRLDEAAQRRLLTQPLAETLGLKEVLPSETLFAPTPDDEKRRRQALASAFWRFPAVERRMKEVYGLRLPRHLAVWAAFHKSLSPLERQGLDRVGRSPWGIMLWFQDGGLERQTRDGLDPRLESRFRADPPELVTVMGGDTDGLHYGLWYDDPAELPSFVAHNYARDSAETSLDGATVLETLREQLRRRLDEPDYPEEKEPLSVHALVAALDWFRAADDQALADDGPRRWAEAPRGNIVGSLGPALLPSSGNPRANRRDEEARYSAYKSGQAQPIIDQAWSELKQGKPAYALVVGRELHWLDADDTRAACLELLIAAYDALGRHALAEIVRVHHQHRDLTSVGVY
jgi:hypothetical protein